MLGGLVPPRGAPALLWWAAAATVAVATVLTATGAVGRGSLAVLLATAGALSVLVCIVQAIERPHERAIWLTLGVGKVGWALAAPAYLTNDNAVRDFPTVGDAALLFYPAMAVGFALLARRRLKGLPRALWLDAALGGVALAAVAAAVVYEPMLNGSKVNVETVALVYALIDVALAGFMGVALLFAGRRSGPALIALGLGAVITAVADGSFAHALHHGALAADMSTGVVWATGVVVVAAAAPLDRGPLDEVDEPGWSLVAIPAVGSLAALAIIVAASFGERSVALYLAYVVALLAITRLTVTLIDNRRAEERRRREHDQRHAREEAERANQAKTEFLSRMSHEVRTPLNSILGFAQLLVDDVDGPDRTSVERILRAGNHLKQLIDDILDLSSIEAGQTAMTLEPTDTEAAIDESTALLEPLARRTGTRIVRRIADDAPDAVVADPQRLKQVLLNLISNAMKYGGHDSDVVVRVERDGVCAVIKIVDKGPGIPAEHMANLFTPFERGSARGSGIEGSGLGLALTKNLVETMGGTIDVDTGPGGSTFCVRLPAAESGPAQVAPRERGDRPQAPQNGTHTVLYIEDNASNIDLVERLLARRGGIELLPATTGQTGLELAESVRPDAILLDLDLPDMRGERVLERLRSSPATGDIPVIVVSADATGARQEQLARAGAVAYVVKPIQLASFMATLDAVLTRSETARARPSA
jgi:signal transduction histidine kinase/ActR/RegA family two-component response regulator